MTDLKQFKANLEGQIKESDQVFITPHVNADFDAIASAIGFSQIAAKCNRPNYIFMCDEPYKIEPGVKTIIEEYQCQTHFISLDKYRKIKGENDLLIATDVNKDYLIACREYLANFRRIAILDHHKPDEHTITSDNICIPTPISSTCEAMYNLLCQFGVKYDDLVATYLLAGIYLDTDKLKKGCTPKTFEIVAKLMKKGASLEKVQEYFAEEFKNDQKIQSLVQKTILETFTYALAIETGDITYTREDLAKVADKLLSYKAVDASFAVGKIDDSTVSISARSKGKLDVSQIMAMLAGGGNVYSAATKIQHTDIEEVGKQLTKALHPTYYVDPETNK